MELGKNIKAFKLLNGEMVLTEIEGINDEGNYVLIYPAIIVPIPPQQAGGQQGQVGFGKLMPFSDYSEEITLNPNTVTVVSVPDKNMKDGYEGWIKQVRAQESGIVVPSMNQPNIPKSGQAIDFSKLNTGR
jgi:hypothetical protein